MTEQTAVTTRPPAPDPLVIDETFWDCPQLDAEEHVRASLGSEPVIDEGDEEGHDWKDHIAETAGRFLPRLEALRDPDDREDSELVVHTHCYTENTDSDLDRGIHWALVAPADADPYWCDECWVVVRFHGFDKVQVFHAPSVGESGFLDWVVQWDAVRPEGMPPVAWRDEGGTGWSPHPTSHLDHNCLKKVVGWSERRQAFLAWDRDGLAVELHPAAPYYSYA